jgi:hypothetical protein
LSTFIIFIPQTGCGFGEECLLIAKLAKEAKFPIKIVATDISEDCLTSFQSVVNKMELTDIITIKKENLYTTSHIDNNFDIVYTSACIEPLFSLKMLLLALSCSNCQYLLCNHQHCSDIYKENISSDLNECVKKRGVFAEAQLETDSDSKRKENRWVYALNLQK